MAQATAAAGDGAVQVVGGPTLIRQLLDAGLADELRIDVMPVLLGSSLRLFDDGGRERLEVEKSGGRGDRAEDEPQVPPPLNLPLDAGSSVRYFTDQLFNWEVEWRRRPINWTGRSRRWRIPRGGRSWPAWRGARPRSRSSPSPST
ncbi:MAG TPA: dihydrofolate reductase family protein [Actinomycetota bacterium]|nr:dihydrofolate reductase family protein [Actinomycetota bacterium]